MANPVNEGAVVQFLAGYEENLSKAQIKNGTVYFALKKDPLDSSKTIGSIYLDALGARIPVSGESYAILDAMGDKILSKYIKAIELDGSAGTSGTLTYIKGDGTDVEVTIPEAAADTAGIVTTNAQVFAGNKTFNNSVIVKASSGFTYEGIEQATSNNARVVWFAHSNKKGTPVYHSDFTYNPSTGTLVAKNFNGLAAKATADATGQNILSTYIKSAEISADNAHLLQLILGNGNDGDTVPLNFVRLAGDTMTGQLVATGGILVNTNTGSKPLLITRLGNSKEQTAIYQDDSTLHFDVENDETTAGIQFKFKATDTESGGGAGANEGSASISLSKGKVTIAADYFTGLVTKATGDSAGNNILDKYISSLAASGHTVNSFKFTGYDGNGAENSTITLPVLSDGSKATLLSAEAQTIVGKKTFNSGVDFAAVDFNYSKIEAASADAARSVWFADSAKVGKPVYSTKFTYNPHTDTVKAANFNGLAAKATADANGSNIRNTYIATVANNIASTNKTASRVNRIYYNGAGKDVYTLEALANRLHSHDIRDNATITPALTPQGLYLRFGKKADYSISDSGNYVGIMSWRAYGGDVDGGADLTGGLPIEIMYTQDGNLWTRLGKDASTWNDWNKILTTGNYTNTLDSRYVNVSGDTMTGNLTVPNLTATANITANGVGTLGSLQVNGNANVSGSLSVGGANASYDFSVTGTGYFSDRVTFNNGAQFAPNKVSIAFRDDHANYKSSFMYGTSGNEALGLVFQNAVTSFMVVHGSNPPDWNTSTWQSATPTIQTKNKSLYVNELIANGVAPTYNFKVKGSSYLDGTLGVSGEASFASNVAITGTLGVTGAATFTSPVTMENELIVKGGIISHTNVSIGSTSHPDTNYKLYVTGKSKFTSDVSLDGTLHLTKTTDAAAASDANVALIIGSRTGEHLIFDANEIMAKSNGTTASTLYLNNEGGLVSFGGGISLQGNITYKNGSYTDLDVIKFITGNNDGCGVVIGGGGVAVFGSGESASRLVSDAGLAGNTETTYITSDNNIYFYTKMQDGRGTSKSMIFDTSGQLYNSNAGTGSVGTSANPWEWFYGVHGNLEQELTVGTTLLVKSTSEFRDAVHIGTTAYPEKRLIFAIARKKEGGGGWAYQPIQVVGGDNADFAHVGVFGNANELKYIFIGAGGYDSTSNFRIYKDGKIWTPGITVTGNVSVGGTLSVTGATTLSNTLTVAKATVLQDTLSVTGVANFTASPVNISNLLTVQGGIYSNRAATVGASFWWNKSGTNWGGIGYNGVSNENYLGPCDGAGNWKNTETDSWRIQGKVKITNDTSITGTLRIDPTAGSWCEGIRIAAKDDEWVTIALGTTAETGTHAKQWSIHRKNDGNFCIAHGESTGTSGIFIRQSDNFIGLGTIAPSYKLHIIGDTYTEGWLRTKGNTGWYSETHGGGWYMTDGLWIKVYGGKDVLMPNNLQVDGAIYANGHIYWKPNTNIYCQPTAANQEWSIDVGSTSYAGSYFHVWSAKNSKSILRCNADDNSVVIENGSLKIKNQWIDFDSVHGLRWSNYNGALKIYPNNITTYGGLRVEGKRGGYHGILLGDSTKGLVVMDDGADHRGLYQEQNGCWIIYHNNTSNNIGIGTSGLQANYKLTVGGPTYINGRLVVAGNGSSYNEGIRVLPASNGWSNMFFSSNATVEGTHDGGWLIGRRGAVGTAYNGVTPGVGDFTIEEENSSGLNLTIHKNSGGMTLRGRFRNDSEIQTSSANAYRMVYGSYGVFLRQDGSHTYFLITGANDQYGTWNGLRPFYFSNTTGRVYLGNGASVGGYSYGSDQYSLSTASFICNDWVRTVGNNGWYNQTHGGGWYMQDSTYIRTYNNKAVLINNSLYIGQTDGSGLGVSLYGTSAPSTYGILFGTTGNFGKHGDVQSDWATYFTMNAVGQRGWVFRAGSTNVASVSANGAINANSYIQSSNRVLSTLVNGGSWIHGSHNAAFQATVASTAAAGNYYQAWFAGKSISGAWSIGALSGYNDLYFVFGSDTNYSAGTNTTSNIKFGSDGKVWGAVWNDYAEFRQAETIEPGRVVVEHRSGEMKLSTERLQPGANVISDTYGFTIGQTDKCQTPIAVAGRVLVYPYEDIDTYELGDAVCSGPNGTVSKMTREEIWKYPERIVGTVSEIPTYKTWGSGNVEINGRIWIKVK
jgi:hypothetical protein